MNSRRLEAFSDGVIAIIITIMVLELRPPEGTTFTALRDLLPNGLAYLLSFVFLAIYWNNHHHLMQLVEQIDGAVLWANMLLLFWLSLVPFSTAWMGEHHDQRDPVLLYGIVLLGAAISYFALTRALLRLHGQQSTLANALGSDRKGTISAGVYVAALVLGLFSTWLAIATFVGVAIAWLVPDRRISRAVRANPTADHPDA
ncbi:MAG: TMEM175 family protein [Ilumatobacteraceae bacterium]